MTLSTEKNKVCNVEGCDKSHKAFGYCNAHRKKFKKYGDPLAGSDRAKHSDVCGVETCDKPYLAKGYCQRHYNRFHKYGDPLGGPSPRPQRGAPTIQARTISKNGLEWSTAPKWRGITCKVENCDREAKSLGLCKAHYQQAMYDKKYEHLIPEKHRKERCTQLDCENPQYANGLCRACDSKAKRGTLTRKAELHYEEMKEPGDNNTISGRIKNARLALGWTREELAEKMGFKGEVSKHALAKIERHSNNMNPPSVKRYADALGVNIALLYPSNQLPNVDEGEGAQVARARILRGWTLQEVASRTGVSREYVRILERQNELPRKWIPKLEGLYNFTIKQNPRPPKVTKEAPIKLRRPRGRPPKRPQDRLTRIEQNLEDISTTLGKLCKLFDILQ